MAAMFCLLHWLPIKYQVIVKALVITIKLLHGNLQNILENTAHSVAVFLEIHKNVILKRKLMEVEKLLFGNKDQSLGMHYYKKLDLPQTVLKINLKFTSSTVYFQA